MYSTTFFCISLLLSVYGYESMEDSFAPSEIWAVLCLKIMQFIFKVEYCALLIYNADTSFNKKLMRNMFIFIYFF